MFRIVGLQITTAIAVSLLAWMLASSNAAISALLGGAVVIVPNGLFALKLHAASRRQGGTTAAVFFAGEAVKVLASFLLLTWVILSFKDLVWLAMLIALIATTKSYIFALLFKH